VSQGTSYIYQTILFDDSSFQMATNSRTFLAFQQDSKLYSFQTTLSAVLPFTSLQDANRQLFKDGTDKNHVLVTEATIFHPQGGGQPSDVGTMTSPSGRSFIVVAVRMDAIHDGRVLHLGYFNSSTASSVEGEVFQEGDTIQQAIDVDKRLLYSRLHTAGHVLGAAVRRLLENEVEGFDELKASHFPDSAACEFQGLIDGKWKEPIQKKVDEYIAAKMPVEVEWWTEDDFRMRGLERLIPNQNVPVPDGRFRVVNIVGAEVYPCGGTHVDTTDLCGKTTVRKISRNKGNSRVSYAVH
jgi:Ser-tRNA(Ala) deacylase AlaX